MPLPKRVIDPIHVCRSTVPSPEQGIKVINELETVTNGTLAHAIQQLSSLSRHAEDLFGELAREAHSIASRANSLQARLDKLAIKTTQLDSAVEDVSLQDMRLRKAFKSAVVFDQQVVSRDTMPTAMLETYKQCEAPPPLYKLNAYRDDGKDGMKFYTDPDYFFQLWRQEMLKDTERVMHDKGKKPHKPRSADTSSGRHKKRVRQPNNTRDRLQQIAVKRGEHLMPNECHYAIPPMQQQGYVCNENGMTLLPGDLQPSRPNSIEIRRNYSDAGIIYSPTTIQRHTPIMEIYQRGGDFVGNHYEESSQYRIETAQAGTYGVHNIASPPAVTTNDVLSPGGTPTRGGTRVRPTQPPPAPPSATNSSSSTPSASNTPTRGRSLSSGRETLPPPPPPPVETTPLAMQLEKTHSSPPSSIPPPPPPPPPLPHNGISTNGLASHIIANGDIKTPAKLNTSVGSPPKVSPPKDSNIINKSSCISNGPQYDPRNDLLKAIRDGIKLRKVEKIEQKEGERVNVLHDVASILSRRVAVEISDSDSDSVSEDSEYDSEGWAEQETTTKS